MSRPNLQRLLLIVLILSALYSTNHTSLVLAHRYSVDLKPRKIRQGSFAILEINVTKAECRNTLEYFNLTIIVGKPVWLEGWDKYIQREDDVYTTYFYEIKGVDQFTLKVIVNTSLTTPPAKYDIIIVGKGYEKTPEGSIKQLEFNSNFRLEVTTFKVWAEFRCDKQKTTPPSKVTAGFLMYNGDYRYPYETVENITINITVPALNYSKIYRYDKLYYEDSIRLTLQLSIDETIPGKVILAYAHLSYYIRNVLITDTLTASFIVTKPAHITAYLDSPSNISNHSRGDVKVTVISDGRFTAKNVRIRVVLGEKTYSKTLGDIEPGKSMDTTISVLFEGSKEETLKLTVYYESEGIPGYSKAERKETVTINPTLIDKLQILYLLLIIFIASILMATIIIKYRRGKKIVERGEEINEKQ